MAHAALDGRYLDQVSIPGYWRAKIDSSIQHAHRWMGGKVWTLVDINIYLAMLLSSEKTVKEVEHPGLLSKMSQIL
ncbi:hypothetical protein ElyMa_002685500 [Elysia marginata]|uniref:Uncharacterized protein n=1 Tax=Elysia marginata TaxID=1093978 RepID=A0AAV4HEZ0_9GAST|nr:hypothetical protein ElyMa_002685500 [Elysia marginata]